MAWQSWDTPLLRAIACHHVKHIDLLIRSGANPNGIDRESQASYARRFRRYRSDAVKPWHPCVIIPSEEVGEPATQLFPLSNDEKTIRSTRLSCFWTFPGALPLNFSENGDLLHTLVMAAKTTVEIFDKVLQAGADANAWKGSQSSDLPQEDLLEPSSLCISTPLHAAIDAGNLALLDGLLARDFNPNARALIAGCQALTPSQHAIMTGKPELYQRLATYPRTDVSLVTPVFGIHVLHFAVAQLRLDLMDATGQLSAVAPTALGHTLLHIACLPLDECEVQCFGPKVRQSVHDLRSCGLKNLGRQQHFTASTHLNFQGGLDRP